jgi:hypothetical protein
MFGNINELFHRSSPSQQQNQRPLHLPIQQQQQQQQQEGEQEEQRIHPVANAVVQQQHHQQQQQQQQQQQRPNLAFSSTGNTNNDVGSVTQKDVDLLLAKELQSMSCQERTQCIEEMHGIISEQITSESVEQTSLALKQFDQELYNYNMNILSSSQQQQQQQQQHQQQQTHDHHHHHHQQQQRPNTSAGYAKAVLQNTSSLLVDHVRNRTLKIQMLRAEKWNVSKAVHRMIKFFDFLEIINNSGCGSSSDDDNNSNPSGIFELPTIQDFNPAELEILQEGSVQILPSRDAVGRQILARLDYFGLGLPTTSVVR